MTTRKTPSFKNLHPTSKHASKVMSKNRKIGTECERVLRSHLWHLGLRFRKNVSSLPGTPDVVFPRQKVAVFCDGDFWHGRNWDERRAKLAKGSNADYWIAKIESNQNRDREQELALRADGWEVIRLWESDIKSAPDQAAKEIAEIVGSRRARNE